MRIVRSHVEPWQKNGSSNPSPTLSQSAVILSPTICRRQRPADGSKDETDTGTHLENAQLKRMRERMRRRSRYPQVVKKLSMMCSDAIARNVKFESVICES